MDSQELFDIKEPLVADLPLGAPGCSRRIVPGFLGAPGFDLGRELRAAGFTCEDLHANGEDGPRFFTESRVVVTRWL